MKTQWYIDKAAMWVSCFKSLLAPIDTPYQTPRLKLCLGVADGIQVMKNTNTVEETKTPD
jgi:hypothetical protein